MFLLQVLGLEEEVLHRTGQDPEESSTKATTPQDCLTADRGELAVQLVKYV